MRFFMAFQQRALLGREQDRSELASERDELLIRVDARKSRLAFGEESTFPLEPVGEAK